VARALRQDGFRALPEGMRKCYKCHEVKEKKFFYKDSTRASGVNPKCKTCTNRDNKAKRRMPERRDLEVRRIWAEKNRERLQEYDRQWREDNRDKHNAKEARRRARKRELPDSLTGEEYSEIKERFFNLCSICENDFEHMDHFIPLASGHGGTYYGNMVPMCSKCNTSKRDSNPFEWAKSLTEKQRKNFDTLIHYLSGVNKYSSVSDYEAYVHKCFK